MKENITFSEKFEKIGKELLKTEDALEVLNNSNARIIFLESDKIKKNKGKTIFAECEKVADKNKFAIDADFIIRVYRWNCLAAGFTESQYKILIYHELLHAGVKYDKKGKEQFYIVPHDIEDFRLVTDRFGLNLSSTQKEFEFV